MGSSHSTSSQNAPSRDCKAVTALKKVECTRTSPLKKQAGATASCFPTHQPSASRLKASLDETPFDLSGSVDPTLEAKAKSNAETVLYLAYGSNLAAETFLGRRGIRPLSQINIVAPALIMTFDLPGIPYTEPCFANSAYRSSKSSTQLSADSEKAPLLPSKNYTNPYWPKGLVGVVYEVTPSDFAHIIATEGGGSSYQDVLVDCYPLPIESSLVPAQPDTPSFKAHTLFSPVASPGDKGRFARPDPEYAQPSARYLKLITDGADQHALPEEYKAYLHALQPYTITTNKQRLGSFIFRSLWFPIVMAVFSLGRLFHDKNGKSPAWYAKLTGDGFFKGLFGDGERTIEQEDKAKRSERPRRRLVKSDRQRAAHEKTMVGHEV